MKIDKYLRITMTRSQICDLMKACTACATAVGPLDTKWEALHSELFDILREYDKLTGIAEVEEED